MTNTPIQSKSGPFEVSLPQNTFYKLIILLSDISIFFFKLILKLMKIHYNNKCKVNSVQFSRSVVSNSLQPHESQHVRPLCHHQLLESTQAHVHWVGDAIQPSPPLSSSSLPSFNLSQHKGLFQWICSSHQVAKYWSFSFNISHSNEYSGLISFRMDWLDFLVIQGTLRSLLQHHSSKASILQCSAFFIVQLSHPYTTTGITIALTRQTFVGKVMSLILNMLSWS